MAFCPTVSHGVPLTFAEVGEQPGMKADFESCKDSEAQPLHLEMGW